MNKKEIEKKLIEKFIDETEYAFNSQLETLIKETEYEIVDDFNSAYQKLINDELLQHYLDIDNFIDHWNEEKQEFDFMFEITDADIRDEWTLFRYIHHKCDFLFDIDYWYRHKNDRIYLMNNIWTYYFDEDCKNDTLKELEYSGLIFKK